MNHCPYDQAQCEYPRCQSVSSAAFDPHCMKHNQVLTFRELLRANASRVKRWHPGGISDWNALEWAGAMCGEAGEAANAAKKLKRIEDQIQSHNEAGRHFESAQDAREQVGKEVADTIIYGLLLAQRVGVDIEAILIDVFNRKSIEYGFPERIGVQVDSARGLK